MLDAYELASYNRFDILVLIACDGDYLPLVRKLSARGVRVMVLGWDFRYTDANGYERETRTAQVLLDNATYPIEMVNLIEERTRNGEVEINSLFVPRREYATVPANGPSNSFPTSVSQVPSYEPSVSSAPEGLEMVGTISALRNGYGFITPAIGGENIFFFHADVVGSEFLDLQLGEKVEYISSANERGPCAKSVKVVG